MRKVKSFIKKHNRLYVIARCIKNLNDPNYVKLVKGYYENLRGYTSVLMKHNGEKYSDDIVYYINFYISSNAWQPTRGTAGFCAILRWTLDCLLFSDFMGLVPVVEWGRISTYYDPDMDAVTTNVFEYYFEPVSAVCYKEIKECRNIIEANGISNSFFFTKKTADMITSYQLEENEIEQLGYLYRKYIRLNQNTKTYIAKNLNELLGNETVLAVHVRGTDFNWGTKDHPVVVTLEEYLTNAKSIFSEGRFDKVFLATDDENALDIFKQEFKEKLIYYTDVFRTKGHIGPHSTPSGRPMHRYNLGLEVLRDVYTLANCDSFVCGLSQVSFAARYINISLNRKFKKIVVLDKGISTEDSAEAKKTRRQIRKMNGGG